MRTGTVPSFARRNYLRMASIFLAFAILSNVFYIPCYYYIRQVTRSNVLEYHQRKLDTGMRTFTMSFNALSTLDEQLFQDPNYRSITYPNTELTPQQLTTMRSIISNALSPYDFIAEAGLSCGDEVLFNRQHLFFQRELLRADRFFACSRPDFLSEFEGQQCVLPVATFSSSAYGTYDAFAVAFRWSALKDLYYFATYPLDKLFPLLAEPEALRQCRLSIYSGSTLIAASGPDMKDDYAELSAAYDNTHHLRAQLLLSDAYIEQDLKTMHRLVQIFAFIVILAMLLWIVLFALAMARPLNRIGEALENSQHLGDMHRTTTTDMVEGIRRLDNQLTDYSSKLNEQHALIRIHHLERAIYRGLYNEESRLSFRKAFPQFPARWQLALVQYASEKEGITQETLQAVMMQHLQQELPQTLSLSIGREALLVLIGLKQTDQPAQALAAVCHSAQEKHGILMDFTLSPEYDDPARLADAFQQLEYESIVPEDTSGIQLISMQQLQTIYLALQCGDETAAINALTNGTSALLNGTDFFLAQYAYRMIANVLVRIKLESNCNLNDIPIPSFRFEQVRKVFTEEMPDCFRKIAQKISQEHISQSHTLEQEIITYIRSNVTSKQLCLTMVTEHFGISAPTLQKRLNASIGKTFASYVEELRMHLARHALMETDRTVQEIADEIGYSTVNSFYKAYKRYFGETPRSFRKGKT